MSHYDLTLSDAARRETGATSLAIGWDPPLNTFFLQLANTDVADEEEPMIEWIGGEFSECVDVDHILAVASKYAIDAPLYRDRLISDRLDVRERTRPRFL